MVNAGFFAPGLRVVVAFAPVEPFLCPVPTDFLFEADGVFVAAAPDDTRDECRVR